MTELLSACRIARWRGSDNAGADAAEGGEEAEEEGAGSAGGGAATASMSALCPPEEENAAWVEGHVSADRSHKEQKTGSDRQHQLTAVHARLGTPWLYRRTGNFAEHVLVPRITY